MCVRFLNAMFYVLSPKARKRHILVNTLGLLLSVVVHPANVQDRDGAPQVPQSPACARLRVPPSLRCRFIRLAKIRCCDA